VSQGALEEARLRELLRAAPVPGAAEAERRGLRVVETAFAERAEAEEGGRRLPSLPRLTIALAIVTLLAALLLSPAGASVRHWIGDVFEPGVRNAEPALTRIPGGGRLVVDSPAGPWVVRADGARRLLGHYREATWSPHGLYLAAVSGRMLTAVAPDGTPRWSLAASARVEDPRWSPSGYRIAYRGGGELRVVHADGEAYAKLRAPAAPVAPTWSPDGVPELAYVDRHGHVVVADANSGRPLASAVALPGIASLQWGAGGVLLEVAPGLARLRRLHVDKLDGTLRLERPTPLPLAGSGRILAAALSPQGRTVALLRQFGGVARTRAEVDLLDIRNGRLRRLFRTPGRLGQIVWSPDSSRLLITWPQADQWLFVPVGGRSHLKAIGDVARQFSPGTRGSGRFPTVAGWCCPQGIPRG
jgi:hypothetical protein